ncbi:hypothetical protein JOF53_000435 [Crossiella equi]|uniref:ABC-2 family transporter protein n=1 Tax=Crossiella equi TaxID=130796 RepID=A0ABS5A4R1_9PSEU|nr:hypothetical protein [Crossiella equi]MBP2471563.1 hypothetical protein [Crossiella equi]
MIWTAWRMQRTTLLVLLTAFLVGLVSFAVLRHQTLDYIDLLGLRDCLGPDRSAECAAKTPQFGARFSDLMRAAQMAVLGLPVLLGVFLGAPLFARELEQGTHVLALTQSVSRNRWFGVKTAFALVPAALLAQATAWLLWWWLDVAGWLSPRARGFFLPSNFGTTGLVLLAYTVFAVALGILLGMVTRRVVTAMTLTLLLTTALRFAEEWLRFLLAPAERTLFAVNSPGPEGDRDSWQVGYGYLDARGQEMGDLSDKLLSCDRTGADPGQCYEKLGAKQQYADIVPADAYWTVQLVESLVLFGLAAGLLALAATLLRRRSL